ncbi:hypothetical protein GCM10010531_41500 [Blastococcus jejuensis]|uniref:Uncharacterized protein n=1 Tax=Blastococcus jejuensis TaxID=351224 RepID=A0ABP6PLX4_9ACTN
MRPPTHDDPNAIPRNGTDVPWVELDDPSHRRAAPRPAITRSGKHHAAEGPRVASRIS